MLFIREQVFDPKDEFEVYSFSMRKYLDKFVNKKPKYIEKTVQEVSEVVGRLEVFTKPISVFTREDHLWVSSIFIREGEKSYLYALVSSTNLSLLYKMNMSQVKNLNMECRFQQIITIKSARQLYAAN